MRIHPAQMAASSERIASRIRGNRKRNSRGGIVFMALARLYLCLTFENMIVVIPLAKKLDHNPP
jgi:hypothetical protein